MTSPVSVRSLRFQSTLPVRGATQPDQLRSVCSDISIHAPREGSDMPPKPHHNVSRISIHAPREGSDVANQFWADIYIHFNPRSP